jgi:hypothetical protein
VRFLGGLLNWTGPRDKWHAEPPAHLAFIIYRRQTAKAGNFFCDFAEGRITRVKSILFWLRS